MSRGGAPAALPTSLVCSACGARLPDDAALALACPEAGDDDVDHLLERVLVATPPPDDDDPNPFVRWRSRFHAYHRARAHGWSDAQYVDLVGRLDDAVAEVDGSGFRITPFTRDAALSSRLGFGEDGGVWVKDETGNVSGSHKGRHLFGTLVELEVEAVRAGPGAPQAPLAIASCGNAALAAAVVARAAGRPLNVFVPPDADPAVLARLRDLGAEVLVRPRSPGSTGDPTYLALLDAVSRGAVAFTCQGTLNGLAVEGGETMGWEIAACVGAPGGPDRIDRMVVQVGGGALLAAVAAGLGAGGAALPRVHAVQTTGAHPLARAYGRLRTRVDGGEPAGAVLADAARHRSAFMWPWESEPRSLAHGILDDETYDWRACAAAMLVSGGGPVVVAEPLLAEAHELARAAGSCADPTGAAGLAGLLDLVRTRAVAADERVVVLFTGASRDGGTTTDIRGAQQRAHGNPASGGI